MERELTDIERSIVQGSAKHDIIDHYIDVAYLTGVFSVSGIDGLDKELKRLKEIGKQPHDFVKIDI
jgi:hypothetical protein